MLSRLCASAICWRKARMLPFLLLLPSPWHFSMNGLSRGTRTNGWKSWKNWVSEWKEKAENLEGELQQCYKAQSRLSEQLVVEVAECRSSKCFIQEKDMLISDLQNELAQARDECSQSRVNLDEKTKALELLISENHELKAQLEEMAKRAKIAEAENKTLVDRWMLQKMKDAECMNEANALYEEMISRLKGSSIEQIARQQVDGVIRQSEEGGEYLAESSIPTACALKIKAHQGSCSSIRFVPNSGKLITGGQDRAIKLWDTNTGTQISTLPGCLGSVLDVAITHDAKSIIAATSSNNLYVWDAASGRIIHTLTGHAEKVCAVDTSQGGSGRRAISAAHDRTIKAWDLHRGYCTNTLISHSNCNAVCFGMDGRSVCSGHLDGNLRLWDLEAGKLVCELAAHSLAVTSVSVSRGGNMILTSGRDNVHHLFDVRSLEICGSFRASGSFRVASNWSRSCMTGDEGQVAAGSTDGSVFVWSVRRGDVVSALREHAAPVLSCSCGGVGKPLASSDKNGVVCTWT